jgi:5-methylcytosine-specific restriction enzyme subunit McrC
LCRLRRDDLDFLLAQHRSHLDVQPTRLRGVYRLTPRGCVGVIDGPHARFEIEPKIPLANVVHLLDSDVARDLPLAPGPGGLIDFLTSRFVTLLHERVAAGLRPGYVEREEALAYLRGRLDVVVQLRRARPANDRLHCRYEDLDLDTPWNRQVKAVAAMLVASPFAAGETAVQIRQALLAFGDIGDEVPTDAALAALIEKAELADYRPLLKLTRVLLAALTAGGARPAFLIDLERAFEGHIVRGLRRALAGRDVRVEAQLPVPIHGDGPALSLRPDIVLYRGERVLAAIDAKWKRLRRGPEADDLHQALAYAAILGAPRAILVYPARRNRWKEYGVPNRPLMLGLHSLQVSGRQDCCDAALERWAQSLI